MDYYLLVYFFVGILQDFLLTLNFRYVAKDKTLPAVTFSFLTTLIGMIVFYDIITKLTPDKSIIGILVYSLGIATGTFFAMKFKFGMRD